MSAISEKTAAEGSSATGKQRQESCDLERKNQQLTRENDELRSLRSFLDQSAKRNLQLAAEWQSFGKYTASVLKKEVETAETKIRVMDEQLKKLLTENKELREMCLYLNRSQEDSNVQLTPPESTELLVHSHILSELNKRGGGIIPQYRGLTSENTLKDERSKSTKEQLVSRGMESSVAMIEMKKRVDQLEREKLELVKSLSAAHLLAANTPKLEDKSSLYMAPSQRRATGVPPVVDPPPKLASTIKQRDSSSHPPAHNPVAAATASQETIMTAVTLLDVCRRLDAADANGYTDPRDEMEAATLRVLLGIAWQRIQEQMQGENISLNKHTQ